MITIKYKGKIVDLKDIEINWVEYSKNGFVKKTGDIKDYAKSRYSEGYDQEVKLVIKKSKFWKF